MATQLQMANDISETSERQEGREERQERGERGEGRGERGGNKKGRKRNISKIYTGLDNVNFSMLSLVSWCARQIKPVWK